MRRCLPWLGPVLTACAAAPAPTSVPPALVPFVGEHAGTLRIVAASGVQHVPMGLDIAPVEGRADQLRWVLRYGEGDAAQVRDYRLLVDDLATGRCRIDEQNGIELAAHLDDGELVSVFATGGQLLVCRYRAVDAGIEFSLEAVATAGGKATGHDVRTYPEFARQRALLRRR